MQLCCCMLIMIAVELLTQRVYEWSSLIIIIWFFPFFFACAIWIFKIVAYYSCTIRASPAKIRCSFKSEKAIGCLKATHFLGFLGIWRINTQFHRYVSSRGPLI